MPQDAGQAWLLVSSPAIYGGLGLQSAERAAPAAHWAAWMDALPVICFRLPPSPGHCLEALEQSNSGRPAPVYENGMLAGGWDSCPMWRSAYNGARPPLPSDAGPRDWPHGGQHHATRTH